ncbi:cyclophilin-like fold protein [Stenoxybacter acetivorans]|uniref:cyclophilin-like fold protein n=1 Tax=Stenoxybacter acetivorans TaxID=422441 RepID=UPI00055C7A07|nr:cyclophilin-like fold protein [Stenoxybacter acetivorans]
MKIDLAMFLVSALLPTLAACNGVESSGAVKSASVENSVIPKPIESAVLSEIKQGSTSQTETAEAPKLIITIGSNQFTATMTKNSSAAALIELLSEKPLTIQMRDYGGFEKVGALGRDLPTNNEQITTTAGDLILYQGNQLCIYYASNSWNFTRIGKIDNVTSDELKKALGHNDVSVTLSVSK